jgi:hypothetical protein
MNRNTFGDTASGKRGSLAGELDLQDDDLDVPQSGRINQKVDGEDFDSSNLRGDVDDGEIEAFNLKDERDGDLGYFDDSGNYIFKRKSINEDGEADAWEDGLDESKMEQGIGEAAAAKKRQEVAASRADALREERDSMKTTRELQLELVHLMSDGESVSQTLRRLSGKGKEKLAANGNSDGEFVRRRRKNDKPETEHVESSSSGIGSGNCSGKNNDISSSKSNSLLIIQVTELADQLLGRGWTGIMNMRRSHLWSITWNWEYKDAQGNIQGPFTAKEMGSWKNQGYFTGTGAVQMRRVVPTNTLTDAITKNTDDSGTISGSNKRSSVHFEDDDANKQSAKRAKLEPNSDSFSSSTGNDNEDLLNDLNSDSDDEKAADICVISESYPWVSSDSVDFGSNFDEVPNNQSGA